MKRFINKKIFRLLILLKLALGILLFFFGSEANEAEFEKMGTLFLAFCVIMLIVYTYANIGIYLFSQHSRILFTIIFLLSPLSLALTQFHNISFNYFEIYVNYYFGAIDSFLLFLIWATPLTEEFTRK